MPRGFRDEEGDDLESLQERIQDAERNYWEDRSEANEEYLSGLYAETDYNPLSFAGDIPDDLYAEIHSAIGGEWDDYANELLETGWFADVSSDEREWARQEFFDYMDIEREDFPWEEWRDEYAA